MAKNRKRAGAGLPAKPRHILLGLKAALSSMGLSFGLTDELLNDLVIDIGTCGLAALQETLNVSAKPKRWQFARRLQSIQSAAKRLCEAFDIAADLLHFSSNHLWTWDINPTLIDCLCEGGNFQDKLRLTVAIRHVALLHVLAAEAARQNEKNKSMRPAETHAIQLAAIYRKYFKREPTRTINGPWIKFLACGRSVVELPTLSSERLRRLRVACGATPSANFGNHEQPEPAIRPIPRDDFLPRWRPLERSRTDTSKRKLSHAETTIVWSKLAPPSEKEFELVLQEMGSEFVLSEALRAELLEEVDAVATSAAQILTVLSDGAPPSEIRERLGVVSGAAGRMFELCGTKVTVNVAFESGVSRADLDQTLLQALLSASDDIDTQTVIEAVVSAAALYRLAIKAAKNARKNPAWATADEGHSAHMGETYRRFFHREPIGKPWHLFLKWGRSAAGLRPLQADRLKRLPTRWWPLS